MHSLGSISAIASEKKIFLYFPIWSCVNTMACGGGNAKVVFSQLENTKMAITFKKK